MRPKVRNTGRASAAICAISLSACLALTACGDDKPAEPATSAREPTAPAKPRKEPRIPTGDGAGGVTLEKVGDFDQPLYVTQPPSGDEALFVVEQCGRIMRVEPGGERKTFLDISGMVTCGGEQGLLSAAFAPDYERSGRLYVNYTDTAGDSRTVEYRRTENDPGVADPESARELLRIDDRYPNHNGGLLLFGPGRVLYLGMGDGGAPSDQERTAQDLGVLLGKILAIDPRPQGDRPYGIPASNPYAELRGAERPEIYAYGLRNPWRFSFDRETGELWIGDVGQSSQEEVDAVKPKAGTAPNFGWSAFEGTKRFNSDEQAPGHIEPLLTYGRERGCSITGGYVVRDPDLRSLYGRYLYGDYCQGELRSITADVDGEADDDRALGVQVPSLSSFGEDTAGHVYATSLEGPVYRLAPDA